ncbi:MAG: type II toxin-antitoxin system RatA family toxin [Paralcaligenes sp.]
MHTVQRSVLVSYSCAQMFDLVADVEKYPEFMPWCGGASVRSRDEHGMQATIIISFAGVKQAFSTRNDHEYPHLITFNLVDGPFSALTGKWVFNALAEDACKVVYTMEYAFSSRALELLVGPVFNRIATSFIDSFTARAQACYGPG